MMTAGAPSLSLVAIGGTLCDERVWQDCLPLLPVPYRVVTSGRLLSGTLAAGTTMQSYAEALLSELPDRFALAGFSLGGLVALEMARQQPDRIAGLALIAAGAGAEQPEGAERRRAWERYAAVSGLSAHFDEDLWPLYSARSMTVLPFRKLLRDMAETTGIELYRLQNDLALTRSDSFGMLASLRAPLLLATGADDVVCPRERHQAVVAGAEMVERHVIPGCGHFLPLERPEQLARIMETWITSAMASE
jgi:pimeloyl-ACP methyl ester carboxylesterase